MNSHTGTNIKQLKSSSFGDMLVKTNKELYYVTEKIFRYSICCDAYFLCQIVPVFYAPLIILTLTAMLKSSKLLKS